MDSVPGHLSRVRAQVRIDNGPPLDADLVIDRQVIVVESLGSIPDRAWIHVDAAGHFHAWAADETLPTLTEHHEQQPCDGSCGGVCEGEGYTVTTWTCRICTEPVEPGTIPGPHTRHMPRLTDWRVEVRRQRGVPPPTVLGHEVSIRATVDRTEHFGVAILTDTQYDSDLGWTAIAYGNGPLGQRPVRRPVAAGV
jgi:hypothetical protein